MGDEICNYCKYYISIPSSKYSFSCHHFGDGDTFESRNHLMFGFFKGPNILTRFAPVAMDQTWSNIGLAGRSIALNSTDRPWVHNLCMIIESSIIQYSFIRL